MDNAGKIIKIEFPDHLVGNAEGGQAQPLSFDGEQAHIIQQTDKIINGKGFGETKLRRDADAYFFFTQQALQYLKALEFQPAQAKQVADFPIIRSDIGVQHFLRRALVALVMLGEVKHHVRVVQPAIHRPGRKMVAVVPVPDLAHDFRQIFFLRSDCLHQAGYFFLGKAQHGLQIPVQAQVAADVEARCQAVHRQWRNTSDENAVDDAIGGPCFDGFVELSDKAVLGDDLLKMP